MILVLHFPIFFLSERYDTTKPVMHEQVESLYAVNISF